MFKKLNHIKTKLILTFSFFLIIPTIAVGVFGYLKAEKEVTKAITDNIDTNLNLLNSSIDQTINSSIFDIETFSKEITTASYQGESTTELRKELAQYSKLHPEIFSIYVGTSEGDFIEEPIITDTSDYDPRIRDWYKESVENNGQIIISEPYPDITTGDMVVTISKTTADGEGVVGLDLNIKHLQDLIENVQIGESGHALLIDKSQTFIAHPTEEPAAPAEEEYYKKMFEANEGAFDFVQDNEKKYMSFHTNELTGWKIGGTLVYSEIKQAAAPILHNMIIIIVIALILGGCTMYFVIRSIIKPLKVLKEKAITVSKGDLTEQIQIKTNDEIGHLATAFNEMQNSLRVLVQQVEMSAEEVAASSEQLSAISEETTAASQQVASSIQEVASNVEKQAYGAKQSSELLNDFLHNTVEISNSSSVVTKLSYNTLLQAEEGEKVVENNVEQMNSIHESVTESNKMMESLYESTKKVSSILAVITEIAEQTNLLSLNAAIEAARAGEHGKGFSVVADEVRKLAEQSQKSVQEINTIVHTIQNDTENTVQTMLKVNNDVQAGVQISQETIQKFNEIIKSTKEITPQMEEISATAKQLAENIQINATIASDAADMAQKSASITEEIAASSEEQLAAMENVSSSAQSLTTLAEALKSNLSKFKY